MSNAAAAETIGAAMERTIVSKEAAMERALLRGKKGDGDLLNTMTEEEMFESLSGR